MRLGNTATALPSEGGEVLRTGGDARATGELRTGGDARATGELRTGGGARATGGGFCTGGDARATEWGLRTGGDARATGGLSCTGGDARATGGGFCTGGDARATGELRTGGDAGATELEARTGGDARATGGERFPWVEVFRGLAILEVVFHHASGRFLGMLDREGVAWLILAILNRTLHYAVPAFLMMTAFVLALSLLREFRPTRYFGNRALRALLPYLLWSGLYLMYRFYAFGASPDWSRWADYLFWGKAYFHLYFLAVAMQLYLLLPLLLPTARLRLPFWAVLIGIVTLTMAVYWTNRLVYRVPYTGSYVLWYTPVILLGLWLATQANRLQEVLRRGWLFALLCASVGLWLYLPLALQALQGLPVNTFQYQTGNWLFTTGVSFLLLAVAYWLSQRGGWMVSGVQLLGRYSLQIYLLHPLILSELSRWSVSSALQARWGLPLFVGLALLIPFAVGWLLSRAPRVSVVVFGRA